MKVLVDTTVWSLAFRRRAGQLKVGDAATERELRELVRDDRVMMIGPVRQELLSGIKEATTFTRLRDRLRAFEDEPISTLDYEHAAHVGNLCRARGVAGSTVDFLICAVAERRNVPVFTLDRDFDRYATVLPFKVYRPAARPIDSR